VEGPIKLLISTAIFSPPFSAAMSGSAPRFFIVNLGRLSSGLKNQLAFIVFEKWFDFSPYRLPAKPFFKNGELIF